MAVARISGSFRDPSGFVFLHDELLYRQVNLVYREEYDALATSGLLERLCKKGLLVRHEEADLAVAAEPVCAYKVLKPDRVPFISYPYEWSFSMYKAAALATLEIQSEAMACGLSLKDATAYNIQFVDGRPVFIDTLSFERYGEGAPWPAYRQFCQHFLAPLALMARVDIRLGALMRDFVDGIPLDLASRLLGWRARWNPGLLMHVHLHGKSQIRHAGDAGKSGHCQARLSKLQLQGILESLRSTVRKLSWTPAGTEWADYYTFTNYSDAAFEAKHKGVEKFIEQVAPRSVWDLGANNGEFTRLASRRGIPAVAFDIDPAAVEKNYRMITHDKERNLLPLVLDLTNPSPAVGWAGEERDAFVSRGPVDLALALAVIHHIAISNNVPLERVAAFLARICRHLVIEFVPKEDSQVQTLLASRKDIFPDYTQEGFEKAFGGRFETVESVPVAGSQRTLYLMRGRK